jgi:hypothetical protein
VQPPLVLQLVKDELQAFFARRANAPEEIRRNAPRGLKVVVAGAPPDERHVVKARQGVELVTSGEPRVVDSDGQEDTHDGQTLGEIVAGGQCRDEGLV